MLSENSSESLPQSDICTSFLRLQGVTSRNLVAPLTLSLRASGRDLWRNNVTGCRFQTIGACCPGLKMCVILSLIFLCVEVNHEIARSCPTSAGAYPLVIQSKTRSSNANVEKSSSRSPLTQPTPQNGGSARVLHAKSLTIDYTW